MRITISYTGDCPYLNDEHTIYIECAEITVAGNPNPGYKKLSYECDYVNECPYPDQDRWGRCPLYISAPSHP